jgi:TPR repeat protein
LALIIIIIMSLLIFKELDRLTTEQKIEAINKALLKITKGQLTFLCNDCNIVYELIVDKIIPVLTTDTSSEVYMFLARFYQLQDDFDTMMKYDLIAINQGNTESMIQLALHFETLQDKDNMMKYYLMAIEKGSDQASCYLGNYYFRTGPYAMAIKYYLISIEKGNKHAMINIARCYTRTCDYNDVVKYFLMAYENGLVIALNYLGDFYQHEMYEPYVTKYYLMAIDNGNFERLPDLYKYYLKHDAEEGIIIFDKLARKGIRNADYYMAQLLLNVRHESFSKHIIGMYANIAELETHKKENIALKEYIAELELLPDAPKYIETKKHFESLSTAKIT